MKRVLQTVLQRNFPETMKQKARDALQMFNDTDAMVEKLFAASPATDANKRCYNLSLLWGPLTPPQPSALMNSRRTGVPGPSSGPISADETQPKRPRLACGHLEMTPMTLVPFQPGPTAESIENEEVAQTAEAEDVDWHADEDGACG